MGRDKLFDMLRNNDMLVKRKKNYKKTTNSYHRFHMYSNRIKHLKISKPEQVFVNDITYIKVKNTYAYLFLTTDAYSKKIMGWTVNYTMKVKDAKKAIRMVCKNRSSKSNVFHHSDRGIQYCTPQYTDYIKSKGMIPSMTENDHVYENAIAERVNGILKDEFAIGDGFNSLKQARNVIQTSISIYNNTRRHMSLGYLTPNFVHYNPSINLNNLTSEVVLNCNRISG
jgi:transposase InsO family protein